MATLTAKKNNKIRVEQGNSVPKAFSEMERKQLEETLLSEIQLKNAMQEFIIKENLSDDFDIWMKKKR